MDLVQLRSFVAIARSGSFRRAAEELHMAQPSLSQQIRRLESELNVQLFDRGRRPVTLTEPGRVLLDRAEGVLRAVSETTSEIRDFDRSYGGRVAVGAIQSIAQTELPDLLATFRNTHPQADLRLRIGNSGEISEMLYEGDVDIALIRTDANLLRPEYAAHPIRTERLVLITAHDNPLAERSQVSWRELADASFVFFREGASIRDALIDACADAGFRPDTSLEMSDMATAVALVEKGLGITLVSEFFAEKMADKVARVVVGDGAGPLTRTLILAWDKRTYQSQALRAFKSLVLEGLRPQN